MEEPPSTSIPWIYLSSLSFLSASAIFYLALAHLLPVADLGAVVILSAIATVMTVVFSLGTGPAYQHFLSFYIGRSETATVQTLVRSAFFLALILSAASAAATLTLSTGLSDFFFHTRAYSGAIAILAVFAGVQTANSAFQSVLLGLQRFAAYSVVYIVGAAATYGLALEFFWIRPGVDSIVMGWALGAALACVLYVVTIRKTSSSWSGKGADGRKAAMPSLYRNLFAYSLPLLVWSALATGALYVDRLVLASVANLASVGVYNYALLVASGSLVIVNPFAKVLIPKTSKAFGKQSAPEIQALTERAVTLITLIYLPIGLGLAAIGPVVLKYLAGPGFVAASVPLVVLLVIFAAFIPYSILSSVAAGTRRTLAFAKSAGLALGANIVLSVALVPRFGMLGAALGNSSMVWVPFLVFYFELRDTGLVRFDLHSLSRIWLAAGTMSLAVGVPLYLLGYNPVIIPVFVLLGILGFAVLLRALRAIPSEATKTLLQVLPRPLHSIRPVIYWLAPGYSVEAMQGASSASLSLQR